MELSHIRRILLGLTGTAQSVDPQQLNAMNPADWARLQAMAEMHRLQPWLHWNKANHPGVPNDILHVWQAAHRRSAMTALVRQTELAECVQSLRADGFDPVALKGAYLAFHAYPEPALRPMRDLDLILPENQVIPAYDVLRSAGYDLAEALTVPIEDCLRFDKHLPLMLAPRGTPVELHKRLSQPDGRLDLDAPHVDEAVLMDRAMTVDGLSYPVVEDMLAHLIVHAVHGHRLDCGPLILTDIEFLTRQHAVDWPAFWQRARHEGWQDGAQLLFELVRRFHNGKAILRVDSEPAAPPDAICETALDLMLQNLETRRSAKLMGALAEGNLGLVWRRVTGRMAAQGETGTVADRSATGGFIHWAVHQAKTGMAQLADREVRAQSRQHNQFRRWLKD